MLSIYTPQLTNRIRYTFDLFFKELLHIPFQLISNRDQFFAAAHPKISYDQNPVADELCFGAVYLLFEKGVKLHSIEVEDYEGTKVFFNTQGLQEHALPFDPFAAAFYLVSRYEELLPHVKDQFSRFPAKESMAFKNGFLSVPVVNRYALMVKQKLQERYPEMQFPKKEFEFIPTYDVDSAYAYLNKGVIRNAAGLTKALLELDLTTFIDRVRVLTKAKRDPYDTYDWLHELHRKHDMKPLYFFLVGDYDEFDKNISINITEFRELITSIADTAQVGIHPSYASNADVGKLKKELHSLSQVLKRDIRKSRQHFLKLTLPETYQNLLEQGITDDYTMGYATQIGFRAGICSPFYFYNLETENKTALRIHPFAVMDATLNYYQGLTPRQFPDAVYPVIDEIKKVNGTYISLWHNNSLSEEKEWSGWKKVYEDMVLYTLNGER